MTVKKKRKKIVTGEITPAHGWDMYYTKRLGFEHVILMKRSDSFGSHVTRIRALYCRLSLL